MSGRKNNRFIQKVKSFTLLKSPSTYKRKFRKDLPFFNLRLLNSLAIISRPFFEFINNAILGQDIQIRSNTLPRRDNIFLDDAISGLLTIALKGKTLEAYNVSSNGELENFLAVDEIASVIVDESNKQVGNSREPITVIYNDCSKGKRKPGIILDNSKLKGLGWKLTTSFGDGIAKTLYSCNSSNS